MSSLLRGNFRMALASLKRSRWRSFLTMFGVIVAVLPVLTILSIGEGVKRQISQEIGGLGQDLITVRPGQLNNDGSLFEQFNALNGYTAAGSLTYKDFEAVQKIDSVKSAAPLAVVPGAISVNGKKLADNSVIATTSDLKQLIGRDIQYGDFFSDSDYGRRTAVIGRSAAENLFGEGVPLGRAFDFRGETFVVRGVFERFEAPPFSLAADIDNAVIVPYEVAKVAVDSDLPVYQILARPKSEAAVKPALASINKTLLAAHGGERDFSVATQADSVRVANRILLLVTGLVTAVASIALLVSGISIMNIMLVTVAERMHEIGIRKAIGATRRQIVGQFMAEAVILSTAGGVIGLGLAFVVQYFLRVVTSLQPVITWQAALLVVGVSLLVGVLFGSIPALKAARKNPIDALRHE